MLPYYRFLFTRTRDEYAWLTQRLHPFNPTSPYRRKLWQQIYCVCDILFNIPFVLVSFALFKHVPPANKSRSTLHILNLGNGLTKRTRTVSGVFLPSSSLLHDTRHKIHESKHPLRRTPFRQALSARFEVPPPCRWLRAACSSPVSTAPYGIRR